MSKSSRIVLEVDPDGIFVSTEPVEGRWFAGFGVHCLLPARGATHGEVLVGRLAGARSGDSAQPVLISSTEGMLDSTLPELRRVETSHIARLHEAAKAFRAEAPGQLAVAFAEAVRSASPVPALPPAPSEPRARPGDVFEGPLPEGAPLLAWAPDDALAVRFRSVEAAFRFASLAEPLVLELQSGSEDAVGKDHGTLRLTLHHLLLPSIWRANPGGEKGVAECVLIVAPPFRAGRIRAAMIFRVVDPELHDHETRAGIALETSPDHRWRPEGDSFPDERVRSAVRAWVGDCEIVATDPELLDRLVAGPGRDPTDWTQEAVATRHGFPEPSRKRAFTLVRAADAEFDVGAGSARERRGARALASRWLGLAVDDLPADVRDTVRLDTPWNRIVAMVADTDAEGATVEIATRDVPSARDIGAVLTGQRSNPLMTQACWQTLHDLTPLGIAEPRATDVAERAFVWFGWRPRCAQGGAYSFHPATGEPSCSIHGSTSQLAGGGLVGPAPPTGVSDVVVGATDVTFRLSIDW